MQSLKLVKQVTFPTTMSVPRENMVDTSQSLNMQQRQIITSPAMTQTCLAPEEIDMVEELGLELEIMSPTTASRQASGRAQRAVFPRDVWRGWGVEGVEAVAVTVPLLAPQGDTQMATHQLSSTQHVPILDATPGQQSPFTAWLTL